MFTSQFWLDTAERAVATAAQAIIAVLIASGVSSAFDVDWMQAAGVGALAAALAVLKALAASRFGSPDTGSFDGPLRRSASGDGDGETA